MIVSVSDLRLLNNLNLDTCISSMDGCIMDKAQLVRASL